MIQDIAPHKLNNAYDPARKPMPEDLVLLLQKGKILLQKHASPSFVRVSVLPEGMRTGLIYLFSVDERACFLLPEESYGEEVSVCLPGTEWADLRELRQQGSLSREWLFAAFTAKHLADWYRDCRFCGRCGTRMTHSQKERAKLCPACGYTAYPRIMPAVIVGVKNGESLLLTRYRTGFGHNALIAGFVEIGETLEETVQREVMEEAGIRVKNIRYYKSQPWGSANDMLTGFYCEVDGDDEIHMDPEELKYAAWVERTEIELQPDDNSLTNEMMKQFKTGKIC